MFAGLRALLAGVIDYAGLFPPAKLPLDQAIRNYARYRQEPESWMLGRFVCPAARLAELAPYRGELFDMESPMAFSVLGRGGDSHDQFLTGLRADLQDITSFQKTHAQAVTVDVLEVSLPPTLAGLQACDPARDLLRAAADLIDSWSGGALTPYYEIPRGQQGGDTRLAILYGVLHELAQEDIHSRPWCRPPGLKLRCGGLEAAAFPSPELVAGAITTGQRFGVKLKFTAGLHHPVRHFDTDVNTKMHGFLNVFGAGVLAHARRLIEKEVRQIIEDEDAAHFAFDEQGFRWKDITVTPEEITAARRDLVTSFGSCSFDEPRDDLRALGWLP
jgi:hypothetical protein